MILLDIITSNIPKYITLTSTNYPEIKMSEQLVINKNRNLCF